MDIDQVRVWSHVGTASLLGALSIVTFLLRGKTITIHRALLASLSFALASAWFWMLSATVKDHAFLSRTDLMPGMVVIEFGFMAAGWVWFFLMWRQTFVVVRHRKDMRQWTA